MTASLNEKLKQLQAMGYDPVVANNALQAADGDIEVAVEIIQGDETNEIGSSGPPASNAHHGDPGPTRNATTGINPYEGKQAKDVIDQWSQQLLGEKHPEVKARAQEAGKSVKGAWSTAVGKLKELDEKHQISTMAKDAINTCDQKAKAFDQKHNWSKKTNQAAADAGAAYQRSVESAKRSLAE
mmetsp:Transcript_1741/g.2698  ORF Transcript_1741/g.2698 Transcript_1741/m.2698 type:complete len:184 (-) Transcript_1741:22-573(-)